MSGMSTEEVCDMHYYTLEGQPGFQGRFTVEMYMDWDGVLRWRDEITVQPRFRSRIHFPVRDKSPLGKIENVDIAGPTAEFYSFFGGFLARAGE